MHRMRLRSPWQVDRGDNAGDQRCDMPDENSTGSGTHVYRRKFNQPSGLEPDQKIWLIVHAWNGSIDSIAVNGSKQHADHSSEPLQIEITGQLQRSNQIEITVLGKGDTYPALLGPVELGIDE